VRPTHRRPLLAAVLVLLAAAGCSTPPAGSVGPGATPAANAPVISDAWVRPPLGPDRPAAGYLTIVGGTADDALVSAASPVAMSVEIHETVADASGMAAMHPVERIDVATGATVRLEPGGYHLMLMGVEAPLEPGTTVELTLTFEAAGPITVEAEVRQG
jgi:hypothetical protein